MVERSSGSIDVIKKNNFLLKIFFVLIQHQKWLRCQQSFLPVFFGLFFADMLVFQELRVADSCLFQHLFALTESPFLVTRARYRQREEQSLRMRSLESPQLIPECSGKTVIALKLVALQPVLHDTRVGIAGMMSNRQFRIAAAPPPAVLAQLRGCLRPHAAWAARLTG